MHFITDCLNSPYSRQDVLFEAVLEQQEPSFATDEAKQTFPRKDREVRQPSARNYSLCRLICVCFH